MKFDIITLFPEMFVGPLSESIIKRAQNKGLIDINLIQLRDFAEDKHRTVDDTPYGGGKGMVMKVDVVDKALNSVISTHREPAGGRTERGEKSHRTILLDPRGEKFNQEKAIELAQYDNVILLCGHYEGFDARVDDLIDEKISIGDFVLTGGELPAMMIVDAVSRMVPGVLAEGSADDETFMNKDESGKYLNEYPQYTRPDEYKGMKVPDILKSGNHAQIEKWKNSQR